jgi:alcohol dehydrogenase class IV
MMMSPTFEWRSPTEILFGWGRLSEIARVVDGLEGGNRALVMVGSRTLSGLGITRRVSAALGSSRVVLLDGEHARPTPENALSAARRCLDERCDHIVAIGGGATIDVAKLTALLATNGGRLAEYVSGARRFDREGLPLVAVPTTAGSSSEVTPTAVLWPPGGRRISISSPLMYPAVALVDPQLTMSMPKALAADSGMDALTSAFESYWSRDADPISATLDLEVIRTYSRHLERSCNDFDRVSRTRCHLASTLAGIAYGNSRPNACHAVGHLLTEFAGVSHGQAVGVTLPWLLKWNAPLMEERIPRLLDAMDVGTIDECCARLRSLMETCGLQTRLRDLGVNRDDFTPIVERVDLGKVNAALPHHLSRRQVSDMLADLA